MLSSKLEDVTTSIQKNKICLKVSALERESNNTHTQWPFVICLQGILATPDYSRTGELQTLNMKLRTNLDLFANVVHVRSLPGVKTRHNVSTP